MPEALWTPFAEAELEDILYYLAVEDKQPVRAERIAVEIRERATRVASTQAIWQRHPDLPPSWYYSLHKRWIIVFRERVKGIEVLRVIDGARDFTRLFGDNDE